MPARGIVSGEQKECRNATVPRSTSAYPRTRRRPRRSHGNRHAQRVWPPNALRSRCGLSGAHDQEVASEVNHSRTAVVPAGRDQYRLPQAARCHHLGRMGGRKWQSGAGLWGTVALVGCPRRPFHRPNHKGRGGHSTQPQFTTTDRLGMESSRRRRDGAATVPRVVPVLCRRGKDLLPAVPTLMRHIPRRAVQHRQLRASDADGGAGDGAPARRVRLDGRGRTSLPQPL